MTDSDYGYGMTESTSKAKLIKRRDRCCCNLLHITTATLLIGFIELWYFAYEIFSTTYYFVQTGEQYLLSLFISLFAILLGIIASVLLFVAVKTSTPYLLVPHLLMQTAAICLLAFICLFCLFSLITGTSLDFRIVYLDENAAMDDATLSTMTSESTYELIYVSRAIALILSVICIFLFSVGFLQVWMFVVVFRCFFYLQRKTVVKSECIGIANGRCSNSIQMNDKKQNCTASDAKNNNCASLEMVQRNSLFAND